MATPSTKLTADLFRQADELIEAIKRPEHPREIYVPQGVTGAYTINLEPPRQRAEEFVEASE